MREGPQVLKEIKANKGDQGPAGPKGDRGRRGYKGEQGYQGRAGVLREIEAIRDLWVIEVNKVIGEREANRHTLALLVLKESRVNKVLRGPKCDPGPAGPKGDRGGHICQEDWRYDDGCPRYVH